MPSNSPGQSTPFWDPKSSVYSKQLWLPIDTNLISENNYNASYIKLNKNTWFSANQFKNNNIYNYKLPWLSKDKKNSDDEIKCKKIQLFPNSRQRKILNNWFHTARWVYNKCLVSFNNNELKIDRKELRKQWLDCSSIGNDHKSLNTPYAIRDGAIDDLITAYTTNINSGKQFKLKFRSKKSSSESIMIQKANYKQANVFYPSYFNYHKNNDGSEYIKSAEKLPDQLDFNTRLQRTKLGNFYLCILSKIKIKNYNQAPKINSIISLDPGVRTFVTGYDPNGNIYEWGKNDITRLFKLGCYADKLKNVIDSDKTIRHRTRYRLRRKVLKIFKKIRDLVDTLHKNLSKWLCENYNHILIPDFKSSGIVRKKERKINNKTVRNVLTWSHYRFKQRLLSKAREYPWCKVIETTEEFTSKTCGNCGTIKENLGGNKKFECFHCKIKMDRDFNGARNILLKYYTKLNPKLKIISKNCIVTSEDNNTKGNIYPKSNLVLKLSSNVI